MRTGPDGAPASEEEEEVVVVVVVRGPKEALNIQVLDLHAGLLAAPPPQAVGKT